LNGCGLEDTGNKVKKWNLGKGYHPKKTADNGVSYRKARDATGSMSRLLFQ
jgi:hypothetical protein